MGCCCARSCHWTAAPTTPLWKRLRQSLLRSLCIKTKLPHSLLQAYQVSTRGEPIVCRSSVRALLDLPPNADKLR